MPIFQTDTLVVERDTDGSAVLVLDVPGKTHNVFTRAVLTDLAATFERLAEETNVPVLVLRSGKPTGFVAGADVRGFLDIRTSAEAAALSEMGQRTFNQLAALPMPTIAVVHGPCLGGGLEFALACDYRLVFDKASTQLGLPEVQLGLLPGWGGTQRLPRTIGLERALNVILGGKRLNAREAFRWGLADALAANEVELREQYDLLKARAVHRGKVRRDRLPLRTWRQRLLESNPLGRRILYKGAERLLRRKVPDDMPAPAEALQAVRVGLKRGQEAGLAYEREAASRLALTTACHNLIGVFLATEAARKLPEELRALHPAEVHRVGVVGAGAMGAGIAQLAAVKGCEVVVQEVNEEALGAGILRIKRLFDQAVAKRVLSAEEAQRRLSAVRGTLTWEGFNNLDVVVEAALEDLAVKRPLFRELEARTRPTTVLATNTSSLPVTQLQEGLAHPERVAGLHFFNPVHKMPLVEVARAPATDERTMAELTAWAIALGKMPVQVRDSPGFVVNRVLMPYLNEAVLLVAEGLKIDQVDHVMRRFGMPMGPLELLDQIGLDVAAHVARSLGPTVADRFPPNTAFEQMRERGWLGIKSGRGFYSHRGKRQRANFLAQNLLRSEGDSAAAALAKALPLAARLVEARERMVLLMVNEAAQALGEGVAANAEAIDLAMILGTGWAPHRGGPLHYADDRGSAEVVKTLSDLAARHGKRFEPSAQLRQRADSGTFFTSRVASSLSGRSG
jgi:3-hydroxyacyl-CoA dehydrogenase/enoyl-CoA hydratase/3-hydroxybutyryl-CoA epimerase